MNNKLLKNIKS